MSRNLDSSYLFIDTVTPLCLSTKSPGFSPFYHSPSDTWIGLDAQINYYDISKGLLEDKNITELIKTNLLATGYEASKKFLDYLLRV